MKPNLKLKHKHGELEFKVCKTPSLETFNTFYYQPILSLSLSSHFVTAPPPNRQQPTNNQIRTHHSLMKQTSIL